MLRNILQIDDRVNLTCSVCPLYQPLLTTRLLRRLNIKQRQPGLSYRFVEGSMAPISSVTGGALTSDAAASNCRRPKSCLIRTLSHVDTQCIKAVPQ